MESLYYCFCRLSFSVSSCLFLDSAAIYLEINFSLGLICSIKYSKLILQSYVSRSSLSRCSLVTIFAIKQFSKIIFKQIFHLMQIRCTVKNRKAKTKTY